MPGVYRVMTGVCLRNNFIDLSGKYQGLTTGTVKERYFSPLPVGPHTWEHTFDQTLQLTRRFRHNVVRVWGCMPFFFPCNFAWACNQCFCHEDYLGYFENQIYKIRDTSFSLTPPKSQSPLSEHVRACSNASLCFSFWNPWGALAIQIPDFFTIFYRLPRSFTFYSHALPCPSPSLCVTTTVWVLCAEDRKMWKFRKCFP